MLGTFVIACTNIVPRWYDSSPNCRKARRAPRDGLLHYSAVARQWNRLQPRQTGLNSPFEQQNDVKHSVLHRDYDSVEVLIHVAERLGILPVGQVGKNIIVIDDLSSLNKIDIFRDWPA